MPALLGPRLEGFVEGVGVWGLRQLIDEGHAPILPVDPLRGNRMPDRRSRPLRCAADGASAYPGNWTAANEEWGGERP